MSSDPERADPASEATRDPAAVAFSAAAHRDFLAYFDNVRSRTENVLDAVPVERFDWRPRPGGFSFADLARHLGAIERWMFAENARGRPSRYPGHGPELADGAEEVRAYLRRMHAESMGVFFGLGEAELNARCETPGGSRIRVWKWLRSMVEHECHHRGQIYLMLSFLGAPTPPLYGLTSEEVRANSLPPEAPDWPAAPPASGS